MTKDIGQVHLDQAQAAQAGGMAERLQRLAGEDSSDHSAFTKEAVKFESMFIKSLLDSMRKTVEESDVFGDPSSSSRTIYQSMLDSEYSQIMASQRKFGIADMLMEQFGIEEPSDTSATAGVQSEYGLLSGVGQLPAHLDRQLNRFVAPLSGPISSPFGMREHPITGQMGMHDGVDLAVPVGTPVASSKAGQVIFAGEKGGYGKVVIVEHAKGYRTIYGHLDSINVEAGDRVRQGQVLARSGNTGRSTGPHLHFEIQKDGRPINPDTYLDY